MIEVYAHEVHDVEAEMPAFLAECEAAFTRDHPEDAGKEVIAEVTTQEGPGPMFTLTAKVHAR